MSSNFMLRLRRIVSKVNPQRPENKENPASAEVLEWETKIRKYIEKPERIRWLDKGARSTLTERAKWIGSTDSGDDIVHSRKLTGHIGEFFECTKNDSVFRRALIALPEAIEALQSQLKLPAIDMWHTCMMALTIERGIQLDGDSEDVAFWGCDLFRSYVKLSIINEDQSIIERTDLSQWRDELMAKYGPRE